MRYFFFIFILFPSIPVHAQRIEILAGAIRNIFFSPDASFEQRTPGAGIFLQTHYLVDSASFLPLRNMYISAQHYSGRIDAYSTSYAGSFKTGSDLFIKRTNVSLGLYPVSLKLFQKKLRADLGAEVGVMLHNLTSGTVFYTRQFDSVPPNYTGPGYYQVHENVHLNSQGFHRTLTIGLCGSLTLVLAENQHFRIFANYSFYRGLNYELDAYIGIRSQRHRIGLGVSFPLHPPN